MSQAAQAEQAKAAAPMVTLRGITKTYHRGDEALQVLHNLDFDLPEGGFVALMGPSGSGKSSLLNIISGLDKPTSGSVRVADQNLTEMNTDQLAKFRAQTLGLIFQTFNLLPVLTALENVELPLILTSLSRSERKKRAETALRIVGLSDRVHHYPRQLSGGQEQRVAIARAIVNDPQIIVADEPTGDLDRDSANEILGLLEKLNGEFGKTILMVTHDPAAAQRAHVVRHLDKGNLQ
ncbi:MAG: ABC transporter ATP-binding protein [Bdellovibrionota bacterium]